MWLRYTILFASRRKIIIKEPVKVEFKTVQSIKLDFHSLGNLYSSVFENSLILILNGEGVRYQ